MAELQKQIVGVLAGGRSNERAVSLKSAEQVAHNLPTNKYDVHIIEIPDGSIAPVFDQLQGIDVAFIAMHGTYAEDGRIQGLLDMLGIPYTGSGVLASAIGMNKAKTCELVGLHGVRSPQFFELYAMSENTQTLAEKIKNDIGFPCVIKPNESGSSVGVSIIHDESAIEAAVRTAFAEDDSVLVEQYIKGREVTCGVLGNTYQTELRALPIVEIIAKASFFDYHAKYESKETQEICPANLSPTLVEQIQHMAKHAHEALECNGLTRSDFMIAQDGTPYFLEINTIPGITEASLCPKEAKAAGISFPEFLSMQIELALAKHIVKK